MALVVEDGSIVAGANSYSTVAEAQAFLSARGIDTGTNLVAVEGLLMRAMDTLEMLTWKGDRTDIATPQPLSWPRYGLEYFDGRAVGQNFIPPELKAAQAWIVSYINDGVDAGASAQQNVILEKVDVLQIEYASGGVNGAVSKVTVEDMPNVWGLISQFVLSVQAAGAGIGYIDHA